MFCELPSVLNLLTIAVNGCLAAHKKKLRLIPKIIEIPQEHTMAKITLEIPDELAEQLTKVGDRLPELMTQVLQQTAVPGHIYRYVLEFLANNPTSEQIAAFPPTPEMQQRLGILLKRNQDGQISSEEVRELEEYERIEHLMVMLKAGNLRFLQPTS
jgi:hypothetical protein